MTATHVCGNCECQVETCSLPINGDCSHAEHRDGDVAVEDESEGGAHGIPEGPALRPEARRRGGEAHGAEQQVGQRQAHDERRRRVRAQRRRPQQRARRPQVA